MAASLFLIVATLCVFDKLTMKACTVSGDAGKLSDHTAHTTLRIDAMQLHMTASNSRRAKLSPSLRPHRFRRRETVRDCTARTLRRKQPAVCRRS
jgi:hypothetical protein